MQSKRHSLLEAIANVFSGAAIAFTITQLGSILDLWAISPSKNLLLTLILTFVSLLRSYIWRRIFNKNKVILKLAKKDLKHLLNARDALDKLIRSNK
jgi:hypothetical protein